MTVMGRTINPALLTPGDTIDVIEATDLGDPYRSRGIVAAVEGNTVHVSRRGTITAIPHSRLVEPLHHGDETR